jgi:hypothetical protein
MFEMELKELPVFITSFFSGTTVSVTFVEFAVDPKSDRLPLSEPPTLLKVNGSKVAGAAVALTTDGAGDAAGGLEKLANELVPVDGANGSLDTVVDGAVGAGAAARNGAGAAVAGLEKLANELVPGDGANGSLATVIGRAVGAGAAAKRSVDGAAAGAASKENKSTDGGAGAGAGGCLWGTGAGAGRKDCIGFCCCC